MLGLNNKHFYILVVVKLQILGLELGVDFTFTWENYHIDNENHKNNPDLNFFKGTVLGDKELGLGIRDKGYGSRVKG